MSNPLQSHDLCAGHKGELYKKGRTDRETFGGKLVRTQRTSYQMEAEILYGKGRVMRPFAKLLWILVNWHSSETSLSSCLQCFDAVGWAA